jgi:hypothetical protein
MSRGPGRIERAIRELLDANPDLAFVTDELGEHCYPGVTPIERKHQVSVLRAAHKVIAGDPDWTARESESQGGTWVFHNRANMQSVALADVIRQFRTIYRSPKRARQNELAWRRSYRRPVLGWLPMSSVIADRAKALAQVRAEDTTPPDGWCVRRVQWHCDYRDGDAETRAAMDAEREAGQRAWLAAGEAMFAGLKGRASGNRFLAIGHDGKETHNDQLATLADRIRAIAAQNDPDVVRTALADIAAELDALGECAAGEPRGAGREAAARRSAHAV